jgi:hypothetical protein
MTPVLRGKGRPSRHPQPQRQTRSRADLRSAGDRNIRIRPHPTTNRPDRCASCDASDHPSTRVDHDRRGRRMFACAAGYAPPACAAGFAPRACAAGFAPPIMARLLVPRSLARADKHGSGGMPFSFNQRSRQRALIGAAHLSISLLTKFPRYCGVASLSGTIWAPRLSSRSRTVVVCIACSAASCSFLTIGSGAPFGRKIAFQV